MTTAAFRMILIVFETFLALTAIAGGVGLLTGVNAPPVDLLSGSPFRNYYIPGLALLVLVGGSALTAAVMTMRRQQSSANASLVTGAMILGFELFEVWTIGLPPGIARNLQIFYVGLGIVIIILSIRLRVRAAGDSSGA